jgi:hypothetical protein
MKNLKLIFFVIFVVAIVPSTADDDDRFLYKDLAFRRLEVPTYQFEGPTSQVILHMAYAEHQVANPEAWQKVASQVVPYEVDLVFTLYPRNLEQWRSGYFKLLNERMKTLFALDPTLNSPDIHWNMVLQTEATSEPKAKEMFHGFVIKYRPKEARELADVTSIAELKDVMRGEAIIRDSTVIEVLDRHPQWKNMLVVLDWTGSMYKHGAQLVQWYKLKRFDQPDAVKHLVFFNDGNFKKTWQKKLGRTGGVYRARSTNLDEIMSTMQYVMKKGNGGDAAENDIEALLTGIQYLEGFDEVILVADNKSEVRDIALMDKVNRPVHVILCDVQGYLHPHYLRLARDTGGSIHTIEKDFVDLEKK